MTDHPGGKSKIESQSATRRTYIVASITGITGVLGGCSSDTGTPDRGSRDEDSGNSEEKLTSDDVGAAEKQIEQVFDLIEAIPISDGGDFVFDVQDSMESVDHAEMSQMAGEALEATEGLDSDLDVSEDRLHELNRTVRVAYLLVDQRILLHRSIVAGLVFKREFDGGKYARAIEVIDEAREFLDRLMANRDALEAELASYGTTDLKIARVGKDSIRRDLDVLLQVLRWMIPVYEGFDEVSNGMAAVKSGNKNLEYERYASARESYQRSRDHFSRAETAFDSAHGSGESVEYFITIVEELRCIIPVMGSGYEDLNEAFVELEKGNVQVGKEIAREALNDMSSEFNKCL